MKNKRKLDIKIYYSFLTKKWSNFVKKDKLYEAVISTISIAKNAEMTDKFALSLVFTDNKMIKEINKDHRNKDQETNVISLAVNDLSGKDGQIFAKVGNFLMLGDIILAFEIIKCEAEEQNKLFEHHLTHLVVHSTLHLLGYNHEVDDEAEEMENLEIDILAKLGISSPYVETKYL